MIKRWCSIATRSISTLRKCGKFLPASSGRGELLSWLMFVGTGVGPFSGQAVHFKHFAPERVPYAAKRYTYEVQRHYDILEDRLTKRNYIVDSTYTIVDMAAWGWTRMLPFILGDGAWNKYPNLKRHHDEIAARPAAARVEALRGLGAEVRLLRGAGGPLRP